MTKMSSDLYPAAYYQGGGGSNYVNYSDDPGWTPTALLMASLLERGDNLLEVGCATGWFVRAARIAGIEAWGADISQWAIDNVVSGAEGRVFQESVIDLDAHDYAYESVVSWEMLEHVPEDEVPAALEAMTQVTLSGGLWVHRIALDDHRHDHDAEDDVTHFTIKPREWWLEQFAAVGATRVKRVEDMFDQVFEGRDWAGRFFVYRF